MLLAIIVVECLFVFASTPAGKKAVRHILASAITAGTGARAGIGAISGNLIESVVIDDLCVYGPDGKSPALVAGRIRASYDLSALFFRKISIHSLELNRMFICMDIEKNKKPTIPGIKFSQRMDEKKQGQLPGFDIRIRRLNVTDSEISITDRSAKKQSVRKFSHISGRAGVSIDKKVFVSVNTLCFTPDQPYPKVSNLSGTISGTQKRFSFDMSLKSRGGLVTLAGQVSHDGKAWNLPRVSGRIAHLNPSAWPFFLAREFSGDISADVNATGKDILGPARNIEIKAESSGILLAGYGADQVRLVCAIKGNDLEISEMGLSAPWGHLNATAEVADLLSPGKNKSVTLMARSDGLDPALIFTDKRFPANLNILVSLSGRIPASLELMDSEFSGDIKLPDSSAAGIEHVTGNLSAVYAKHRLNVESFELASPVGKAIGSGGIDLQTRACDATFSAKISDLTPFSGIIDAGDDITALSGRASVSGTLSGTIERPMVSATLDGAGLGLGSSTVRTVRVTGNWRGWPSLGAISCRARAVGLSAGAMRLASLLIEASATRDVIHVSGTAEAFDTRIHATANLEYRRLEVKKLTITNLALDAKGHPPITNTGPITAIIDGGRIEMHPVKLFCGKAELKLSGRMDITNKKGEYKIAFDAKRDGKKAVALSGNVFLPVCFYPFSAQTKAGHVDLRLRVSDFSLDRIDLPFSDDVLIKGEVFADARITGDFTAPKVAGDLRFSNGSLTVKSLGLSYETCNADIRFSQNRVQVVGINIKGDKEGSLSAFGTLAISDLSLGAIDLTLSGKNFYIPFQNAVFLRTEPDLTLTGTAISPVLKGNIKVTKGSIDLLRLFSQRPAEIEVINAPKNDAGVLELPEKAKQPGFMEPLMADINVTVKRDLWIKGEDENIEIKGRVNVKKRPGHPFTVLGRANTVRGTYMFRNRVFKINDGNLTFLGAGKIDPVLNITGRTRIPPVDILAHLTGTFSRLNLSLDSEPAMDRVDIISYLLFGRASSDLSSGESFKAEDAALSMTGQLAADKLKDILGKSFHLDVVQVNAGSGDIRRGSISMGKYVAPRVFVTYSQGFSHEAGRSVEIDYEINRRFSIEARTGEETTSALDIIWRHDF